MLSKSAPFPPNLNKKFTGVSSFRNSRNCNSASSNGISSVITADCASRDCLSHHSNGVPINDWSSSFQIYSLIKFVYLVWIENIGIELVSIGHQDFFPWFRLIIRWSRPGGGCDCDDLFTLIGDLPSRQFHDRYRDADRRRALPRGGRSAPSISSGSSSAVSPLYSSSNVSWYVASPITAPQSGSCRRRLTAGGAGFFHFLLRHWFRLFRFWLVL
ncbi:hypothetical protein ACNKHP_22705 [Shigella boydii]